MFRQLVENVGGRCDGVTAEKQAQSRALGGGHEPVGNGFVARDVHVATRPFVNRLDAVGGRNRSVGVVAIIIAGMQHADVVFGHIGLCFKLFAQITLHQRLAAVEEPANDAQSKHVAAFQHGFVVERSVAQTGLHHRRDGAHHHAVAIDAELSKIVVGLKFGLAQILFFEVVAVDDDGSRGRCILNLRFQRGGIHRHEHIAEVTWREHLVFTDFHLVSAHARQRTLRRANVGRIVLQRGDAVAYFGRNHRKNGAGQLHSVARIARKPNGDLVQLFYLNSLHRPLG